MPKSITRQDLHDDALVLRTAIDGIHETTTAVFGEDEADSQTRALYDAVTRLHEWAVDGLDRERLGPPARKGER